MRPLLFLILTAIALPAFAAPPQKSVYGGSRYGGTIKIGPELGGKPVPEYKPTRPSFEFRTTINGRSSRPYYPYQRYPSSIDTRPAYPGRGAYPVR